MLYHRFAHLSFALLLLLQASSASFAATVLYAQTRGGSAFRSVDSGKTWQPLSSMTAEVATTASLAVDPQNPNNLYSVFVSGSKSAASTDGVFRSTDGGQSWTESALPRVGEPIVVDPSSANIVYVNAAGFNRSTDSGITFHPGGPAIGATAPASVIKTDPSQPGTVYTVIVNNGNIYKSTDYGVSWNIFATNATVFNSRSVGTITDLAIDPKNSSVLYVTAYQATCGTSATACGLLRSADAGKTWQVVVADSFSNVVVDPRNGNIYAGGYIAAALRGRAASGEVVKSTDGGKTFTSLTNGFSTVGVDVHLDPESENLLYASQARTVGADVTGRGPRGGVYVSTDAGASWTLSPVSPTLVNPADQVNSLFAMTSKGAAPTLVSVSAASGLGDLLAPESIVSAFGAGLASGTGAAETNPPPTSLAGATVSITDAAGTIQQAQLLYVSPGQINYIVPAGLASGTATVTFNNGSSTQAQKVQLSPVAPGLFTFNAAGLVAGSLLRVSGDKQTAEDFFTVSGNGVITARPINLGPATDQIFLILYGTGFRNAGTAGTRMTVNGIDAQVSYAGAQGAFAGLDQVNVLLPRNLSGTANLILKTGSQTANTVNIVIQSGLSR